MGNSFAPNNIRIFAVCNRSEMNDKFQLHFALASLAEMNGIAHQQLKYKKSAH